VKKGPKRPAKTDKPVAQSRDERQKEAASFKNDAAECPKKCPWCQSRDIGEDKITVTKPFPCSYAFDFCKSCNAVLFRHAPKPILPLEADARVPPARSPPRTPSGKSDA